MFNASDEQNLAEAILEVNVNKPTEVFERQATVFMPLSEAVRYHQETAVSETLQLALHKPMDMSEHLVVIASQAALSLSGNFRLIVVETGQETVEETHLKMGKGITVEPEITSEALENVKDDVAEMIKFEPLSIDVSNGPATIVSEDAIVTNETLLDVDVEWPAEYGEITAIVGIPASLQEIPEGKEVVRRFRHHCKRVCFRNAATLQEPPELIQPTEESISSDSTGLPVQVPVFVQELQDVTAIEGSSLQLKCGLKGYPTPEVHWSVDGDRITSSRLFTTTYG